MRATIVSLAVMIALSGGLAVAQSPSPEPQPSPKSSPVPIVVHIKNFTYDPATVTIEHGESVRFVEDDDTAHTVTASDHSYDSGNLDKGQAWTRLYAKAGTYAYFCAYHPYMRGTVVVK